jgi:hypothetical protein
MKKLDRTHPFFLTALFFGLILWGSAIAHGEGSGSKVKIPRGVYIDLTRDFYEALKNEGHVGATVYTNEPSMEYLRQISISARFMVESNLQILKQQERIIQLIQAFLNEKRR